MTATQAAMDAADKQLDEDRNSVDVGDGVRIIKGQRPPNFADIARVFPSAVRHGVIFAYGDRIYVPSGNDLPPQLIAHEKVHCERQRAVGVDNWWKLYMSDINFVYNEEVLAHAAEWKHVCEGASRQVRRASLRTIAKRLSGSLYKVGVSLDYAMNDIKNAVERNLV